MTASKIVADSCQKMEINLCVDEQMVPFTGNLSIKQYVRGKPYPWGIEIFVLSGQTGWVYDFLVYQGSTTETNKEMLAKFGLGAAIVLKQSETVPKGHYL